MKFLQSLFAFAFFFSLSLQTQAADALYEQARNYFEQEGILQESTAQQDSQFITKAAFLKLALENAGYEVPANNLPIPNQFKDVPASSWFAPYVQKALRLGLIEQTEKFNPLENIRSIDALKFLLELEGHVIPKIHDTVSYRDLRTDEEKEIAAKALSLNIYRARSEILFGAQRKLTREEAIVLSYKFYLLSEGEKASFTPTQVFNITTKSSNLDNIEYLESVKEQLFSKYYKSEDLQESDLMNSAIEGFVKGVGDKYTVYFPPQNSKDFAEHLDGSFEGIGAYLEETDQGVVIQTPIKGSPAEKAGVQSGDIIKKVEDVDVTKMLISDVIRLIKGPQGTAVNITFLRDQKEVTIKIIRDRIEIKSVTGEVKNGVLILTVNQFGAQTAIEFSDIVSEMYNPSLQGIVLDLRSNPGGFLTVAEDMLSYWIDEGNAVVQLQYKTHIQNEKAVKNQMLKGVKTAVLQNNSSASASEIVAGTLQGYKVAKVFGETSYGKGSVQEIIQYKNGSSLKVTVAEWLTGTGEPVNHIGVKADVEVQDDEKTELDEVLEKAMQWIY